MGLLKAGPRTFHFILTFTVQFDEADLPFSVTLEVDSTLVIVGIAFGALCKVNVTIF